MWRKSTIHFKFNKKLKSGIFVIFFSKHKSRDVIKKVIISDTLYLEVVLSIFCFEKFLLCRLHEEVFLNVFINIHGWVPWCIFFSKCYEGQERDKHKGRQRQTNLEKERERECERKFKRDLKIKESHYLEKPNLT